MQNIFYIGTPDAHADAFAKLAQADFPGLSLLATNDRKVALAQAETAEVIIGHFFQFDESLLQRATRLRWIQALTSGTDSITQLKTLRPEVLLTSMRGIHGPQMSELIFLHMLALIRDFPRMYRNQCDARWERWPQTLLWGKSIVIVGVGAIAESLAPRCKAFNMAVYGVSGAQRVPAAFDAIFPRDELCRAASLADFLVLLVPHSPQTENLIDARVIAAMKPGSYLINAARGGVLDEQALLLAVREGRIAGAGLDVFRQTPLPADSPLWHQAGVLLTPHVGGMSDVYLEQAYPIIRANLKHFLAGQLNAMINVVPH